jgi:hypothetical protein
VNKNHCLILLKLVPMCMNQSLFRQRLLPQKCFSFYKIVLGYCLVKVKLFYELNSTLQIIFLIFLILLVKLTLQSAEYAGRG